MQIRARLSISADGYVSTPDGWPAQLADSAFVSGRSHGIQEFLEGKEAALMGTLFLGDGMRLTPSLSSDTELVLERERSLPGGSVEIVYACA
jgi:hypothetical protein